MADESAESLHTFVGINSLFFALMITVVLWLGFYMRSVKFHYLPESGAAMLLGVFVGFIVSLTSEKESEYLLFEPELFYFVLLPPIILEAGFSLKRKAFFRNFSTIVLFAVFGTAVSTIVIGYGLYGLAKAGFIPLSHEGPLECFTYGALISAVDPVATLSILGQSSLGTPPLLYTLVFGESVLNDAVAIVMFKTLQSFDGDAFTHYSLLGACAQFLWVSFASIVIGCGVALACASVFRFTDFTEHPSLEISSVLLISYFSYSLAEVLELSGIMALFFCGICMAHYTWYNLSEISQRSLKHFFHCFAKISETFLFIYMGITFCLSFKSDFRTLEWNVKVVFSTIFLCLVSRALNIFPFAYLANLGRRQPIPFKMMVVMWFSGLRGAIAFALALNFPGTDGPIIVTSTLAVVMFTTLVCGGLTEPMLTYFEVRDGANGEFAILEEQAGDESMAKMIDDHSHAHMSMDMSNVDMGRHTSHGANGAGKGGAVELRGLKGSPSIGGGSDGDSDAFPLRKSGSQGLNGLAKTLRGNEGDHHNHSHSHSHSHSHNHVNGHMNGQGRDEAKAAIPAAASLSQSPPYSISPAHRHVSKPYKANGIHRLWHHIDDTYMKPLFGPRPRTLSEESRRRPFQ